MTCDDCEDGMCEWCDGLTVEGFDCDCYDSGHFGNAIGDDDDYEDWDQC